MNRQLESMTRVEIGPITVRVWRTETDLSKVDNADINNLANTLWVNMRHKPRPEELAAEFEKLPRIAAVEVLNLKGDGVLIYPDWN